MQQPTAESIQAATQVAQSFIKVSLPTLLNSSKNLVLRQAMNGQKYYPSLNSDTSSHSTTHSLYAPTSRITWNGNPIPFNDLPAFWAQMPNSKWEVQAWDCQGIPGSDMMGSGGGSGRESLVVSVTGQVAHTAKNDPVVQSATLTTSPGFNNLPRVFAQSFILIFDPTKATGGTKTGEEAYLIGADSFRFV